MTYNEFCDKVRLVLKDRPAGTAIVQTGGFLIVHADSGEILALPGNADGSLPTMADAYNTDSSAWNGESWDGMTEVEMLDSLENPAFQTIRPAENFLRNQ